MREIDAADSPYHFVSLVTGVRSSWQLCTSRSTGASYWLNISTSNTVWYDAGLPLGYGWVRDTADGPRIYVCLPTAL